MAVMRSNPHPENSCLLNCWTPGAASEQQPINVPLYRMHTHTPKKPIIIKILSPWPTAMFVRRVQLPRKIKTVSFLKSSGAVVVFNFTTPHCIAGASHRARICVWMRESKPTTHCAWYECIAINVESDLLVFTYTFTTTTTSVRCAAMVRYTKH